MTEKKSDRLRRYEAHDMKTADIFQVPTGTIAVFTSSYPEDDYANEDAALVITLPETCVLAVADGAGGHSDGGKASSAVLGQLVNELEEADGDLRPAIIDAIERGNEAVMGLGTGAGTTLVVAEIYDNHIRPYHVGDSMLLVVGGGGAIKAQTIAHSPVGYAVESGLIPPDEAMHHDERHVVSNLMGHPNMRMEVGLPLELAPRDTVLLASDGVFDNLHVDEVVELIRKGHIEEVAAGLVESAHQRMAQEDPDHPSKPDDLTFVLHRGN